jgi:hypothetical protein
MDAKGAVPVGTNVDAENNPVAPGIDYSYFDILKQCYKDYTSSDWYLTMEKGNDY